MRTFVVACTGIGNRVLRHASRNGLVGIEALTVILLASTSRAFQISTADLPTVGKNKVAYYTFDATPVNQGILPLTAFTDKANIVVIFEGTLWELADSAHYNSGWMKNAYYKYYSKILSDIKTLQLRGVKVLMNVDDTKSWNSDTSFTTYDGRPLNYQEFALFIDSCITAVGLDGIALDIEHGARDNVAYRNLIKEIGKYVGPLSTHSSTRIYTAAIYYSSYGVPGPTVIGWDRSMASYLNFVMDMGYFQNNTTRFQRWADSLGNSKVMDGFSHDDVNNSLSVAAAWAAWHPNPDKAGVMVYAANVNKVYTDSIFAALDPPATDVKDNNRRGNGIPQEFALQQNYPDPFNPTTTICYELSANSSVVLKVFDALGREVSTLVNRNQAAGRYTADFDGAQLPSGVYFYRLTANGKHYVRKMILLR